MIALYEVDSKEVASVEKSVAPFLICSLADGKSTREFSIFFGENRKRATDRKENNHRWQSSRYINDEITTACYRSKDGGQAHTGLTVLRGRDVSNNPK